MRRRLAIIFLAGTVVLLLAGPLFLARAQERPLNCDVVSTSDDLVVDTANSYWSNVGPDIYSLICNYGRSIDPPSGAAVTVEFQCPDGAFASWDSKTGTVDDDEIYRDDDEVLEEERGSFTGYQGSATVQQKFFWFLDPRTVITIVALTNPDAVDPDALVLPAERLLPVARDLALEHVPPELDQICPLVAPTPTPTPSLTPTPSPTPTEVEEFVSCEIVGTVTDRLGTPVVGMRVLVDREGQTLARTVTGDEGSFGFGPFVTDPDSDFDPAADTVRVAIGTQEYARGGKRSRFLLSYGPTADDARRIGFLATPYFLLDPIDTSPECRRDFDIAFIPSDYEAFQIPIEHWPDAVEIFQNLKRAWAFADMLGVRMNYGLPLHVLVWCKDDFYGCDKTTEEGEPDDAFAFTSIDASNRPSGGTLPYMAYGLQTSLLTDPHIPDNREYHEFGHFFQADAFGDAIPSARGNRNHAGYYANATSTDSWTEGFAEFYSMMVSKHVDRDPRPELYRAGAEINLETDYRPWWRAGRREELAIAGLLLDLEDGDGDYAAPPERRRVAIAWHRVVDVPGGRAIVGMVRNLEPTEASEGTVVGVEFLGGEKKRTGTGTVPADIDPASDAAFVIPIPRGLTDERYRLAAAEGRAFRGVSDDDPIDLAIQDVWSIVHGYRSVNQEANGYLHDVGELYQAFRSALRPRDNDGNGLDDLDQIFISHGFFADDNGNRSYDDGEAIGLTNHPARGRFPTRSPRHHFPELASETVTVDTGGIPSIAIVQIDFPDDAGGLDYGDAVHPDAEGSFVIPVPPPDSDATTTITIVADGYLPTVAGSVRAREFEETAARAPDARFLEFAVVMEPGDITSGRVPLRLALALFLGGALVVAAEIMFFARALRRRRPTRAARVVVAVLLVGGLSSAIAASGLLVREGRGADRLAFFPDVDE